MFRLSLFTMSLILNFGVLLCEEYNTEKVFTEIYDKCIWGTDAENKGTSGSGSTIENNQIYMDFLQNFIQYNTIKSVVDLGCGDWMFSQKINWYNAKYHGIDVVKPVIEKNKKKFSSSNIIFTHGGIEKLENISPADLLLCKDVLQHIPNEEIIKFLKYISKFKYCLITNDIHYGGINQPVPESPNNYRGIDLTQPPFNVKGVKILTYLSGGHLKQILLIINF